MAHVEDRWMKRDKKTRKPAYGTGFRWRAVWKEGDQRKTKAFKTKDAAADWITSVQHKQLSGEYVPQQNKRAIIADLLPEWEASLIRLKPSTRGEVATAVRSRIAPKWGTWQVGAVGRKDVQEWVHALHEEGLAARTVDTVYGRLRAFYAWCVTERYVPVSPCHDITLPRGGGREHIYLTPEQVRALLDHMDPRYRLLTEVLTTTGLRFGEVAELRVRDLDLGRRRAQVNRSVTRGEVGTPKTHRRRTVPLTARVADQLAEHVAGKERDDLVFTGTRGSRQINVNSWRVRYFQPAVEVAGLPEELRPHDLRHTTAALAVASGASVKTVQRMLGHASAAMTLDTYAGLFDQELDDVAGRIGELLTRTATPIGHLGEQAA